MSTRHELGDNLSIVETGAGQITFYNFGLALLTLSEAQTAALRKVLNDLERERKKDK